MITPNLSNNEQMMKTFAVFGPQKALNSAVLQHDKNEQKDKFERKYGMLYTAGSVVAGAGILYALFRGGKLVNFTQYVKRTVTKWNAKALERLNNAPNWFQKIRFGIMVGFSKVLRSLQGLGNINPIKDIAVDRGLIKMEKNLHIKGKTLFDKITGFFIGYGKKLAASKYKAPTQDLAAFKGTLAKVIHEIKKQPNGKRMAMKLEGLFTLSEKELRGIVSGFDCRFDEMMKILRNNSEKKFLSSLIHAKGDTRTEKFFNKVRELGDFIPTREMKPFHTEIFSPLLGAKAKISNSVVDLNKTISTALDNIFYNKSLQNPQLRKNYLNLRRLLHEFAHPKKYGVVRSQARAKLLKELEKTSLNFSSVMPEANKASQINEMISLLKKDSKGAIEEIVSLSKVLKKSNPKLYEELVVARNRFQKSFNNAIEFETDKSYRKMLDFSLHSLTTDLMTQAVGVGTVGYLLANKKKKGKEKIPAILKQGIPVVGGLAVAFLCNLRQVASGPGSLFLAIVSGFALNRIGSVISDKYIKS